MPEDTDIPVHYRTTYKDNVQHLLNNRGSRLRPFVTVQSIDGDKPQVLDQYGIVRGEEDVDRYGDTPIMKTPRDRRWVFPRKFIWGDLLEKFDKVKQVLDPTSPLVTGAAYGLGENLDYDIMLPNFFKPAFTGQEADEVEQFDDAKFTIAVDLQEQGTGATGLNVQKVKRVKALARKAKNRFDEDTLHMAITAEDEDWLFEDVKAINGDFINGRPLSTGDLPELLKVNFVFIEDIPRDESTGHRMNPAWMKSGFSLGIADDITVDMGRDIGKKNNVRIYADVIAGASRLEEGKVFKVLNKTGWPGD